MSRYPHFRMRLYGGAHAERKGMTLRHPGARARVSLYSEMIYLLKAVVNMARRGGGKGAKASAEH